MTYGAGLARVVAALGLGASGAVTAFIGVFLFAAGGPLIVVPIVVGGWELREAMRLIRTGPSGSTLVALAIGMLTGLWLASNEGDGPLQFPWRPIGVAILVTCGAGLWLALRWSNRSAGPRDA